MSPVACLQAWPSSEPASLRPREVPAPVQERRPAPSGLALHAYIIDCR